MFIALLSDIHANREAFAACLAQARHRGAERFVLLGDYVGYGADPEWTARTVMELVDRGAMAVLGNHDHAVSDPREQLNAAAQTTMEWTRGVLGGAERKFLETLPLTIADGPGESLFVFSAPEGAPQLPGRLHLRRRTADVRSRPRADVEAADDPA